MRKIRIDDGTKLIELAETLEVDRTTVQLIESGQRLPSFEYVYKFSIVYGISVDQLIELCELKA